MLDYLEVKLDIDLSWTDNVERFAFKLSSNNLVLTYDGFI